MNDNQDRTPTPSETPNNNDDLQHLAAQLQQLQQERQQILLNLLRTAIPHLAQYTAAAAQIPEDCFTNVAAELEVYSQQRRAVAVDEGNERLDVEEEALFWFRGLTTAERMERNEKDENMRIEIRNQQQQEKSGPKPPMLELKKGNPYMHPHHGNSSAAAAQLAAKYLPTTTTTTREPLQQEVDGNGLIAATAAVLGCHRRPDIPLLSTVTLEVAQLAHEERCSRNILLSNCRSERNGVEHEAKTALKALQQRDNGGGGRDGMASSFLGRSVGRLSPKNSTATTSACTAQQPAMSPEQQAAIKEAARRAVFPFLAVGRQAQSLELTEAEARNTLWLHQSQDVADIHFQYVATSPSASPASMVVVTPEAAAVEGNATATGSPTPPTSLNPATSSSPSSSSKKQQTSDISKSVFQPKRPTMAAPKQQTAISRTYNLQSSPLRLNLEVEESKIRFASETLFENMSRVMWDWARGQREILLREQRQRCQVVRDVLQDVRAVYEEADVAHATDRCGRPSVAYTHDEWLRSEHVVQLQQDSQLLIDNLFRYGGYYPSAALSEDNTQQSSSSTDAEVQRMKKEMAWCGLVLRAPSVVVRKALLSDRVEKFHRLRKEFGK